MMKNRFCPFFNNGHIECCLVSGQSVSFLNKRDIFGSCFKGSDWSASLEEVILLARGAIPSKAVEDLMKCAGGLIMKPTISASSSLVRANTHF